MGEKKKMNKLFCGLLVASIFLGGCAKSPQQVAVAPVIVVESGEPVSTSEIGLTVYDDRSSPVLGSRGGVYGETSLVSTGADFTGNIRMAVEQALQQMGLEISSSENAPQFELHIDRLTYKVLDSYFQDIEIKASARVVVTRNGQRFTGRYNSDLNQRLMTVPSDKRNNEMVNQVLDDMLARPFQDESLKAFLSAM